MSYAARLTIVFLACIPFALLDIGGWPVTVVMLSSGGAALAIYAHRALTRDDD